MPKPDITDHRTEKLLDHLNQKIGARECASFAAGYLFFSGLTIVAKRFLNLNERRPLMGYAAIGHGETI